MVASGVYSISFSLLVVLVVIFPKTNKKEMLLTEVSMSVMTVMCYGVICAWGFSIVGIPVHLISISIAYNVLNVFIVLVLLRKKTIQRLYINSFQIGVVLILTIVFLLVELKTFSYELRSSFYNTGDAAGHYTMAMDIVRSQKVGRMPFAPFHNGMMIELMSPFLSEYKYYKAFILADSLHYWFELLFFYSLTLKFSNKRSTKYVAPIITILYWWGYPLFSYVVGNFVYWGWGVLLCGYVVVALERLIENEGHYIRYVEIVLGLVGVMSCYILFVPPLLLGTMVLLYPKVKEAMSKNKKTYIVLAVGAIFLSVITIYSFAAYFGYNISLIFESVSYDGFVYANIGSDFLLTLPIILSIVYYSRRNKNFSVFNSFLLVTIGYVAIMFILVAFNVMSKYYYHKHYYLIWLFWWLVLARGIDDIEIQKETKGYVKSYIGMLVMVYAFCFARLDKILPEKINEHSTKSFGTDLYVYNFSFLDQDYEEYKYSTDKMNINCFVRDELSEVGGGTFFKLWRLSY